MKQCKAYAIRFSPIIALAVILVVLNFFSKDNLTTDQLITAIASSLITSIGWFFSLHLNHSTFQRGEIIKNKDQLISLLEDFFDALSDLVSKRETTEQDIEDLITDKVAEIELKSKQIKRVFQRNVIFLSDEMIKKLNSEPIEILSSPYAEIKSKLVKLKKDILSEIDLKYEDWLQNL